ncbi:DUF2225 domain-containing protein [Flavobacteriales bacterium]|nr:DUF2225 domain-containing protein [Flavobacteriales bacterium]
MKIVKILPLLTVLFLAATGYSQKDFTAIADASFEHHKYHGAIEQYKKAYSKEKKDVEKARILYAIGECYHKIMDEKQAEVWYRKAIKAGYANVNPEVTLHLGVVLKLQERYEEAEVEFENYLKAKPGDKKATAGLESSKLCEEWKANPTKHEINNEVMLNSKQYDYSPSFADKKYASLVFVSSRPGGAGDDLDPNHGEYFHDLYFTKKDRKGKWSTPVPLNETINTTHNEGSASLDRKKSTMYFMRCEVDKKNDQHCKIYQAKKMGNDYGDATVVELFKDTSAHRYNFGYPSMSNDDKYLFFSSNMPGGKGHNDIWYVKYDSKAKVWGDPVNVEGVNTPEDDVFPFIADDGTLYFASEGHLGMGGMDMFKATSTGDGQWGDVANLKYPLNSASDDFGIVFEGKKEKGYFTSNRRNGRGGDDIYSFYTAPVIYKISGTVYEIGTGNPVAEATVKLTDNDGVSVELITDEAGKYMFDVKQGTKDRYILAEKTYTLEVHKKDYLSAHTEESTVGVEESTEFIHDFNIQPTIDESGKKIEIKFPEVLYDLGKYTLRSESKDSLNFLYQTLIDNPTIVIELSAHTDSRGSDKSNQTLSENRAKSCVEYLVEKGIAEDRMTPVGYGETRLIFSDDDIAKFKTKEEQEAAHQKNRRTVFSVLRSDYVPASTEGSQENAPEEGGSEE